MVPDPPPSPTGDRTRGALPPAVALAGYVTVTAAFFTPVAGRLGAEQIGHGDNLESLWNAWWIGRSLLSGVNPWWTDLVFAPEGTPLVWHSLVPVSSATISLLSRWLPAFVAYNALVLAALPLAGVSAWALCRHLTRDATASFVGGLVFMLCPFIVSKTLGHLDLLYGGLLPLFHLCLLRGVEARPSQRVRRAWALAAVSVLILFTCSPNIPIFAANLGLLVLCRQWRVEGLGAALRRLGGLFAPTFVLSAPYLLLVVFYAVAYDYPPRVESDLAYDPEPISLLLPMGALSVYAPWTQRLGFPGLGGVEPAVYLGVVVLPLSVTELWLGRRQPWVRHLAGIGALFVLLCLGPVLQWQREAVQVGDLPVYLPFALWRWVPVLGAVGQAGRYALVVYLALSVGAALALTKLRARVGPGAGLILTVGVGLLVCADFAFRPMLTPLPRPLELPEATASRGRVLDPRLGSAATMYQQTLHGRPIVGGYISRPPPRILERYRSDPVLGWFFRREAAPAPDRAELRETLARLGVGAVLLDPTDPRGRVLASYGFERLDTNRHTNVWAP